MHSRRMREQCSQWLSVMRRSHGSLKLVASDLYLLTSWPRSLIWRCVCCSGSMGYDDILIVMRGSTGAVSMWSITATHPILRIFVYHNHASLVLSGSCDPHGSRNRSDPVTKSYQPLPYATWAILCFQTITYCYHRRACDGTVNQVG